MSKQETRKLQKLLAVLDRVGTATGHTDLSLHSMNVLFTAALRDLQGDPLDSRELAEKVGISTSGVSRAVALLGDWHRGKPGLGLLEAKPELNNRRRKPISLTRRGRMAIEAIAKEVA